VTLTDPVGGHLDATAGTDGAAVFRGVSTGIYTATAAPPPPAPASPATRAVASGIRVQQTSDTTVVLILP
jgi:hypothetical protein